MIVVFFTISLTHSPIPKSINPALEETLIENSSDGRNLSRGDSEKKKNRYEYDADVRLTKDIDGNGNTIDLTYGGDGNSCSTCGGRNGRQKTMDHEA